MYHGRKHMPAIFVEFVPQKFLWGWLLEETECSDVREKTKTSTFLLKLPAFEFLIRNRQQWADFNLKSQLCLFKPLQPNNLPNSKSMRCPKQLLLCCYFCPTRCWSRMGRSGHASSLLISPPPLHQLQWLCHHWRDSFGGWNETKVARNNIHVKRQ